MIVSLRSMSYPDLKNQLKPDDKIVLITCNMCINFCGIGGTAGMSKLENMLRADGYEVTGQDLISIACTVNLIEKHKDDSDKKAMYDDATVVIPLLCEDGLEAAEHVFRGKKIIHIAQTVGIGDFTMDKGVVLTTPFENTGLEKNPDGYTIDEIAEKLNLYSTFFDESEASEQHKELVTLKINGKEITAPKGQYLLQTCNENGIDVPHLCFHDNLSDFGACRLCLVKVNDEEDYKASCCVKIEEGMNIVTSNNELEKCRRLILELIMASGDHDCLTCLKGIPNPMTSCKLQAMIRDYDIEKTRYEKDLEMKSQDNSSPIMHYDPNKCVLCGRCVRACSEIAGLNNLGFVNRGDKTSIVAGLNKKIGDSDCAACLACVETCPTGALSEKVAYFSGEEWTESRKYVTLP